MSTEHTDPHNEIIKKSESKFPPVVSLKNILASLGIHSDLLDSKTHHCRHECGCIENIFKDTVGSFILGYSIKTVLNILGLLFVLKKLKK